MYPAYVQCAIIRIKDYPATLYSEHLLIPAIDLPEVLSVQLWLHILSSIGGDERDLKEVVPHEVESLLDFWDHRWRFHVCGGGPMEVRSCREVVGLAGDWGCAEYLLVDPFRFSV